MREQWVIASKRADFNKIASIFHISPVLARLMRNRDLITEEEMREYLFGTMEDIPSSFLLKDVEKAARLLLDKIAQGKRIRIISDYDVDGVSSNYILLCGLRRCGAEVDYHIPDRVEDGYGINENLISKAYEDGIDTILTCDNGIAAMEQVHFAKKLGMTIIVTDHHEVPYEEKDGKIIYHIPDAAAVVNPKQKDCSYPHADICGAVVSYKLMDVLYAKAGIPKQELNEFLPIAAMATVCDVMPLHGENRILVKEGLRQMEQTEIVGLRALLQANSIADKRLTAYDMGFIVGPCINASGRLKTAKDALELLLCQDEKIAMEKAIALTNLNTERKELTRKGFEEAVEYFETTGHSKDKILIAYLKDCHESIAGIIAGRIKEYYNKPTFVLTKSKDGVKGSGRSIEAYSMYDEMIKVKDCFTKFGGHPMAAGLSMEEDRVEELRQRLNANTSLTEEDFIHKITIDIAVPLYYLSESFVEELSLLEPFGNENPKPVFALKDLQVASVRVLGNSGRCIKLYVKEPSGAGMEAMYFGESEKFIQEMEERYGKMEVDRAKRGLPNAIKLHATYYPRVNEWRGERTLQIIVQNYRFA